VVKNVTSHGAKNVTSHVKGRPLIVMFAFSLKMIESVRFGI
jgi:hypothetical protein